MISVHPQPGKIPIVTASNNNFAIMAAAFLKSIETNCSDPGNYVIYILADKINAGNKAKLTASTSLQVVFIDISDEILAKIELPNKVDYLPKTAYFRLMIPEFFKDFKKILYLDVDVLVLADLKKLWDIDMEGNLSLACQCFYAPQHRGLDNFKIMGIDTNSPYFNSGMLVIDVQKWREEHIREAVNEVLNTKLNLAKAMDEEGLNVVLHKKWKSVDQRWNYPPHIADADNMPFILHFIGYKPIFSDYKDRHQNLFYSYLKDTAWKGAKPYGFFRKALIKGPALIKMKIKELF
jgi:lipopolysaccharide biosynthesis glycosyltransferase